MADRKVPTPEEEILSVILISILLKSFEESMKIFETFVEGYNNKITAKKGAKKNE
jgi:hypothetical protein